MKPILHEYPEEEGRKTKPKTPALDKVKFRKPDLFVRII